MQRSYLDYAMSVIVGRALPDVRDGLKPVHRKILYAMFDSGYRPDRGYVKCSRVVGDVMGQLPPARRLGDLRRAGPDGAALVAALPADRRQRQLRLAGQRPGRRHAIHRVQARPARHGDAAGHRRGHRRPAGQLRRPGQGAHDPAVADPRTCWSTAPRASRSAWPPRSRRTTCGRSARRCSGAWSNPEADEATTLDALLEHRQGPGLPDPRPDRRHHRDPGRVPHRSRLDPDARRGRGRGGQAGPALPGRHRAALPGQPGQPRRADRRAGQGGQARRHRRHPRRVLRPYRHADRPGAQARRGRQGRAEQPLQAHPAAGDLRRQHAGAGRRGAAHAQPGPVHPLLRRAPDRGHPPADRVPAAQGRGAGAHPARSGQGAGRAGRGDRPDPALADRGGRPAAA